MKSIVMECTDDKSLAKEERKRLQIVNAKKKSDKARLVKMADKLYNLRDLKSSTPVGWSLQRIQEYFVWAKSVTESYTFYIFYFLYFIFYILYFIFFIFYILYFIFYFKKLFLFIYETNNNNK